MKNKILYLMIVACLLICSGCKEDKLLLVPGEEDALQQIETDVSVPGMKNRTEEEVIETALQAISTDNFALYCAARGVHIDSPKVDTFFKEEYKAYRGYLKGIALKECLRLLEVKDKFYVSAMIKNKEYPDQIAYFLTISKDGVWYFRGISFSDFN